MKELVCYCDLCDAKYTPKTENIETHDWEIVSTNNSGDLLMEGFDLCPECQIKFREKLRSWFKR